VEQKLAAKLLRKLIRNGMVRTFTKSTVLKVVAKPMLKALNQKASQLLNNATADYLSGLMVINVALASRAVLNHAVLKQKETSNETNANPNQLLRGKKAILTNREQADTSGDRQDKA